MLILGLLLVLASGVAAAVLIAYNTGGAAETVTAFGRELGDVTLVQAFVAGILVTFAFLLGIVMMMAAGKRGRENRARYREARREAKAAAAERDQLAKRLQAEEEERSRAGAEATTVAQPVPHTAPTTENNRTVETTETVRAEKPSWTDKLTSKLGRGPKSGHTTTEHTTTRSVDTEPAPADPRQEQQVITNIRPGQSPSR